MPGKANRSLASSAEDKDRLVFSWRRKPPGGFWLWGFLVVSLLLHATGFYLFQVVYPSSGRLEPFPARVLILDDKNVANAILLQELNDRLVFLQPASTGSESRKGIGDFSVSFRPSFANRPPPFREPVLKDKGSSDPGAIPLPDRLIVIPPFRAEEQAGSLAREAVPATKPADEKPPLRQK